MHMTILVHAVAVQLFTLRAEPRSALHSRAAVAGSALNKAIGRYNVIRAPRENEW